MKNFFLVLNICWRKTFFYILRFSLRKRFNVSYIKLRRGVVVITTSQPHSSRSELSLCAGSNPVGDVSEIRDSDDL